MSNRKKISFNDNWRFLKLSKKDSLDTLEIEKICFDDSLWQEVTLPHTWNAVDGADGWSGIDEGGEHYYRGLGGYRKTCFFEKDLSDKRIFIEFEGANTTLELFVNEKSVGRHEGGYSAFRFDITDFVLFGKENTLAVKVSNAPTDYIAPITNQGDFTKMGGIYRDVSIVAVSPVHIDLMDYGASGVYVTPKNISDKYADIDVLVKLANDGSETAKADVVVEIFDADGNAVASETVCLEICANSKEDAKVSVPLDSPVLWNGVKNPYLYKAKVNILCDSAEVDDYMQPFGIRTYYIDAREGFFLNGEYLDLRGACYHQDSYENGWAMTNTERERDFDIMREMGVNSVRMAHYQHDGYEYDLCDKLGITVWTEIGIVNKMSADDDTKTLREDFKTNAKQQLVELIRQNYNHPSVIVWGISNELHQMTDEIFDFYRELNLIANNEDKTRLKTYADCQFWGRFLELPADAVGYNRYFGWYKEAGPAEKFGEWLDMYHTEKETRPVCVSEFGGGGAISQHKDNIDWENEIDPWGKRHYENYQSALHEKIWAQFSKRKYLWGKYIWCMFDFASDGRQEGDTKGINDKGLVTRERVPKDAYFFYKSVWNSEPMVHITQKRFENRPAEIPEIKVYSNAESVELFVGGISVGKISRAELDEAYSTVFTWQNVDIRLENKTDIRAVATFSDETCIEDSTAWQGTCEND